MSWIAVGVGAVALIGGTAMSADSASSTKNALEGVAKTPFTDYKGIQSDVIKGNTELTPELATLAGKINSANQAQRLEMLNRAIPNYGDMTGQASGNILSMLSGAVPDDVSDLVMRKSAAQALTGGFSGSGMHSDLAARDLGLTSLDMTKAGLDALNPFLSTMSGLAVPPQFDMTSMLLSPTAMVDLRGRERGQNMQAALTAAGAPGAEQVWGSGLQQIGGALVGGGITGGLGGAAGAGSVPLSFGGANSSLSGTAPNGGTPGSAYSNYNYSALFR